MEALSVEELRRLIVDRETKLVELKQSPILENSEELLKQLSSFANRDGGHILIGVRDDGSMEGATIDGDKAAEKITNLARDSTSPQAEVHHRLYSESDGMVLAVRISKRVGMPVAIVRRAGHEIDNRKYYIRTDYGVRLVDDRLLEYLFANQRDPSISGRFQIKIPYLREDISLANLATDAAIRRHSTIPIFQNLEPGQKTLIQTEEPRNMMRFLCEAVPYAMLGQLSWTYGRSWKVEIIRNTHSRRSHGLSADSELIDLPSLPSPAEDSFLHKIVFDVHASYFGTQKLCLPRGTILDISTRPYSGAGGSATTVMFTLDRAFTIVIQIVSSAWSVGLPPGDYYLFEGLNDSRVNDYANVTLDVSFEAGFEVPNEENDEANDHLHWAEQLLGELLTEWDWDSKAVSPELGVLNVIQRDVKSLMGQRQDLGGHGVPITISGRIGKKT